ncbi:hypothetical protein BHE74_00035392 [Ensete ventricosum]|nr:hypothetical protein BHE74_00035392 [Ensete ventricosum]
MVPNLGSSLSHTGNPRILEKRKELLHRRKHWSRRPLRAPQSPIWQHVLPTCAIGGIRVVLLERRKELVH